MSRSDRFRRLAETREAENTNSQKHEVIEKIVGDFDTNLKDASISEHTSESVVNNTSNEHESETLKRNSDNEHWDNSLVLNSDTEHSSVTEHSNIKTKQLSVEVNSIIDNEQSDDSVILNTNTEQSSVTQRRKNAVGARIPRPIEEFEKRLKKPTIEETHTRGTWLIRNDLLKRLDKLAKHQQRGFKTHLVNYALEQVLDELEGK